MLAFTQLANMKNRQLLSIWGKDHGSGCSSKKKGGRDSDEHRRGSISRRVAEFRVSQKTTEREDHNEGGSTGYELLPKVISSFE